MSYAISNTTGRLYDENLVEIIQDTNNSIYNAYVEDVKNGAKVNYVDFPTQEEIDDYNDKLQQQALDAFMLQKETDGGTYYKDIDKRITANLSALDRNILFPIIGEIESCLQPPLSKIKTGDFASALYIFESQNLPTNSFVLDFYNEAKLYCEEYYDTKYPK